MEGFDTDFDNFELCEGAVIFTIDSLASRTMI